jgi:hypothetical protein
MTTDNELVAEGVDALRRATLRTTFTPDQMALVTGMVVDMTLVLAPRIAAIFEDLEPETAEQASFQIQVKLWADAVSLLALPEPSL